jgi:hypothetical protein
MTSPDDVPRDGSRDDPAKGTPDGPGEPDSPVELPFDEEAAWRMIVENYGERAQLESTPVDPPPPAPDRPGPARPVERSDPGVFDRTYLDAVDPGRVEEPRDRRAADHVDNLHQADAVDHHAEAADRHDHFVPPEPPPVPRGTPARRLAWAGLFAPPLLMILAVVFDWAFPTWLSLGLVAAFVGGFVFLVVTMPRDGGDGWGDGAVV